MRPIHTLRLHLKPVREADAQTLWQVLQQPELRDFQDLPDLDVDAFRASIAGRPKVLRPGAVGRFEWLIYWNEAPPAESQPLGWVSLRLAERAPEKAEIGYSIVHSHRGRGVATEAVAGLVSEAFERAGVSSVRAYCVPQNMPSRAVLTRNDFKEEGVSKHGATVAGQPVDVIAYELDRARWRGMPRVSAMPNRSATRS